MTRQDPLVRAGGISFRAYPLEEACQRMAAVGYDGFEVWKPQLAECKTPELLEQFGIYSKVLGLKVCAVNDVDSDQFRPFDPNGGFERTVMVIKEGVDMAHALGVKDLMLWEGVRPRGNNQSVDELLQTMVEIYKEGLHHASRYGVRILVEPHPFSLGMDLDFLTALCDSLDPGLFGVLYDSCHFGVGKPSGYIEAIRILGSRIRYIHLSDSDQRTSELHYPLGKGRLDIDGVLGALSEVDFSGQISLDTFGYPLPEEASKIGIPVLRKALARLGLD